MSDVKQNCPACRGAGVFVKTVMVDFGHGEQVEDRCNRCLGTGIIYAPLPASTAASEQQTSVSEPDWEECERIAGVPDVHDALQGFSEDPTGGNGMCVVRAVLQAALSGRATIPSDADERDYARGVSDGRAYQRKVDQRILTHRATTAAGQQGDVNKGQ